MKLGNIFKTAIVAAAGFFGAKYFGPKGGKIGSALASSLMSSPTESNSRQHVPRRVNLTQFDMPIYPMTKARGSEMPMLRTDADELNQKWEYRLNKYLIRKKALEQTIVKA
tara:strand:- start:34 stop:366 length:333 start_codon:yes stop_codon:yes gene_type:complete